jgi:hypothetical protein
MGSPVETAVTFLLTEADARLRTLMRAYTQEPSDENAQALARHVVRTLGGGPATKPGGPRSEATIRPNTREVSNRNYVVLLFHNTPIAYQDRKTGNYYYQTDGPRSSSRYTSRRTNEWIPGGKDAAEQVPYREIREIYDDM